MRKKELIKFLEKIPGDPNLGLDVLTNNGTEFWDLSMHSVKSVDHGANVVIGNVRLRKSLPERKLLGVKTPGVDGVAVTLEEALQRFKERYDISPEELAKFSAEDLPEVLLQTIRNDLQELTKLRVL